MQLSRQGLRVVWSLAAVCALLCHAPTPQRAQGGDVLSRESDEAATTEEERRDALAAVTAAARRSLDAGEAVEAARLLNRAGRLQLRLNRPQDALAAYAEALAALRRRPDLPTRVNSLNGVGAARAHLSECGEAERSLGEALALSEEGGYVAGKAEALLTLSECQNARDHALALKTAQESLALWQSAGRGWGVAKALAAAGQYQMEMSDLEESERSHRAALGLWRELGLRDEQAESLINLGFIEHRRGAWQNSLSFYAEALALLDEKSDPDKMGQITGGMGEALVESGMLDEGLAKFRESLDYFNKSQNRYGVAVLSWDIGKAHLLKGDYPAAAAELRQALAHAEAIEKPTTVALCREYLGRTHAATGDRAAALEHFGEALRLYEQVGRPREAARTLALTGRVHQQEGRLDKADELYARALAAFRGLSDRVNEAATLYASGTLAMERGDLGAAEESLRRSVEVTENMRRGSSSSDLTAAFSATVHERYEQYAECLMRMHRADPSRGFDARAFEAIEAARGRSLAELLRATRTSLVPGLDPRLAERERSLRQALRVREDARVALFARDHKKEELAALDAELARLGEEYKLAEADIRARHPAYGQLASSAGWTLRRIQQEVVADDETVLLEYSLGAGRGHVWAVTRDRLTSYELPPRALVERAAERVYALLASRPGAEGGAARAAAEQELDAAARELGRLILSPAAAALEGRARVIVVADGALDYVPFQLLPEPAGGEPLVAAREVVNAPSASVLGQLREEAARRPAPARTLAAFGDPVFAADYALRRGGPGGEMAALGKAEAEGWRHNLRGIEVDGDSLDPATVRGLRFAAQELANLNEVARGGGPVVAAGFDATRERLQTTDLSQFAILHFATHGLLDPRRPDNSGLLLSTVDTEGRGREGFVNLRDIYGLRAPVGLVVLSACRTALGKEFRGEGMVGLTRGFLYAGASGVVSSLWRVDDEATSELMKRFYANMLDGGMTPAAALRAAQNSVRQEPQWRSPYYWAAFTLQGEHRQVLLPARATAASFYPKAAVSGLLLLLAAFGTFAAWRFRRRGAGQNRTQ